jgi:hypothetical protein
MVIHHRCMLLVYFGHELKFASTNISWLQPGLVICCDLRFSATILQCFRGVGKTGRLVATPPYI